MDYLLLKWMHILSSTILFGTGIGTAFYKFMADRSGNMTAIATTNKQVVFADWLFTSPTIIIQPVTGFMMLSMSGYTMTDSWIFSSLILYLLAGVCWIPVVVIQIRMRDLSIKALNNNDVLPKQYWHYERIWFWLGVPAFLSLVVVFYLMVAKPIF